MNHYKQAWSYAGRSTCLTNQFPVPFPEMTTAAAKPTTAALTWARNCRQLSEKRLKKGMSEVAPPKKKIFLQKRQLPHWGVVVGLSRNQRKKVQFGSCQEVATEVISILQTLKRKVNKNYLFYPPLSDVSRRVYWNLTRKVLPTLKSVSHQECVVLYGGDTHHTVPWTKITKLAHFGLFGSWPFSQTVLFCLQYPFKGGAGGNEICHTNFTSTLFLCAVNLLIWLSSAKTCHLNVRIIVIHWIW